MMRLRNALALAFASALIPAVAPDARAGIFDWLRTEEHDQLHFGERTEDWLQLQRGGLSEGPPRSQDVEAAKRARERYLRSFQHPIPDSFVDRADGGKKK